MVREDLLVLEKRCTLCDDICCRQLTVVCSEIQPDAKPTDFNRRVPSRPHPLIWEAKVTRQKCKYGLTAL